jgi:hypothetical protein
LPDAPVIWRGYVISFLPENLLIIFDRVLELKNKWQYQKIKSSIAKKPIINTFITSWPARCCEIIQSGFHHLWCHRRNGKEKRPAFQTRIVC